MMNNNKFDVKTEDKQADEVNRKKVIRAKNGLCDNSSQTDAVEFKDFGTNTYEDVLKIDPHGKIHSGGGET